MNTWCIGTDKVGITLKEKMASTTLKTLSEHGFKIELEKMSDEKKYVIVIRDIMERWRSGYLFEMKSAFDTGNYSRWNKWGVTEHAREFWLNMKKGKYTEFDMENNQIKRGVNTMCKIHNIENDLSWLYVAGHPNFYTWVDCTNNFKTDKTLGELSQMKNIYFLDIKSVNSLEFKTWLCDNDERFNIDGILSTKENKTSNHLMNQIELFFREYQSMNIQDVLVNPFLDFMEQNDPIEFTILKYLCKSIQGEVDLIRNYHERFIA